jgi:homoprotocatechuate degradation regulator HpaR
MSNGSMRPFDRSLPMQLMRAREIVMARFRPHLNAHGVTDQQWRIIRALNETEGLEIADLSEQCCLHAASLSRILPKLEAGGLISRRGHANDQRRVIVTLTAKGRRLFATVAPQSEAIYAELAREIGPARLEKVYGLLDELIEHMSRKATRRRSAAARARADTKKATPRR